MQIRDWEIGNVADLAGVYNAEIADADQRNYRAQLFYTDYGYGVTDTVYGFVKRTEGTS